MAKSHNKKRNVGIIYEQIINYVCSNLMDKNEEKAETAIKIIKNNFKKDSQLYKEYKLFKALATTHNVSGQLASSIIAEAKKACNHMFDNNKLEKEKSVLIKELNYNLGKDVIFKQKVKNYRTYATIQTLLNEWRNGSSNFDKVTEYEIKLHESLTQKEIINDSAPRKFDSLTYKLMNEMFDKKYNSKLNQIQQEIISAFINENNNKLKEKFTALKSSCNALFENYMNECNNNVLVEKKEAVFNKLSNLNENDFSKANLEKFLTLAKLKEELMGE